MNKKLPRTLQEHPPPLLAFVGGATGTVLIAACMQLAPAFGLPLLDLPRLTGGAVTSAPGLALGIGWTVFVIGGAIAAPLLLSLAWPRLPGAETGPAGALLKGAAFGTAMWVLSGLVLPVLGALGRLGDAEGLGLFARHAGWSGVAMLLAGHLLYGVALAVISDTGRGMGVLETIGWPGYSTAGAGARREVGQA